MAINWVELPCELLLLKTDFIRPLYVNKIRLLLIRHDDEYFATASRCPHAGGDLSQGWCNMKKIICPIHRHEFDLRSGRGATGQHNYIDTFPLKHENGKLFIGITENWWKFWK